ncbi:MAG: RsmD family RNA methyltransferase, partial [Oscillospiraceae bacterium]
MRVITGTAKGRKLLAPEGLDTRPTSDMAKEAIFSILQFELEGALVLDLFAGSGQLGIEALSRGARGAIFIDSSREAQATILSNLDKTGLRAAARVSQM